MKRLVIAGGGFAGFWAAAAAARLRQDTPSLASLEVLLVSRDDHYRAKSTCRQFFNDASKLFRGPLFGVKGRSGMNHCERLTFIKYVTTLSAEFFVDAGVGVFSHSQTRCGLIGNRHSRPSNQRQLLFD